MHTVHQKWYTKAILYYLPIYMAVQVFLSVTLSARCFLSCINTDA